MRLPRIPLYHAKKRRLKVFVEYTLTNGRAFKVERSSFMLEPGSNPSDFTMGFDEEFIEGAFERCEHGGFAETTISTGLYKGKNFTTWAAPIEHVCSAELFYEVRNVTRWSEFRTAKRRKTYEEKAAAELPNKPFYPLVVKALAECSQPGRLRLKDTVVGAEIDTPLSDEKLPRNQRVVIHMHHSPYPAGTDTPWKASFWDGRQTPEDVHQEDFATPGEAMEWLIRAADEAKV